jgi:hypothetical protein
MNKKSQLSYSDEGYMDKVLRQTMQLKNEQEKNIQSNTGKG